MRDVLRRATVNGIPWTIEHVYADGEILYSLGAEDLTADDCRRACYATYALASRDLDREAQR